MQTKTHRESDPFPIQWGMWKALWQGYLFRRCLLPGTHDFGEKNFLADDILGVYATPKGDVELSEVTFPDFTGPGHRDQHRARYIGLTFASGDTAIVDTFEKLDEALGLTDVEECDDCGHAYSKRYMRLVVVDNELVFVCMNCATGRGL